MEELRRLIQEHLLLQRQYEASYNMGEKLHVIPLAILGGLAGLTVHPWLTLAGLPLGYWIGKLIYRSKVARIRHLHAGVPELRRFIRANLFDCDIWRELIEDDGEKEIMLGPIQVATQTVTFGMRLRSLFQHYPQLCNRHHLRPFPPWYAGKLRSSFFGSKSKDWPVEHLWQYALARELADEFFGGTGLTAGTYPALAFEIDADGPGPSLSGRNLERDELHLPEPSEVPGSTISL